MVPSSPSRGLTNFSEVDTRSPRYKTVNYRAETDSCSPHWCARIDWARAQIWEQLLHRNVQRFRGRLAFKAHRLCVSLKSSLESNKEEEGRTAQSSYMETYLTWNCQINNIYDPIASILLVNIILCSNFHDLTVLIWIGMHIRLLWWPAPARDAAVERIWHI